MNPIVTAIDQMIERMRREAESHRYDATVWGASGATRTSRAVVRARADEAEKWANELAKLAGAIEGMALCTCPPAERDKQPHDGGCPARFVARASSLTEPQK